jgi:hypothetical protein
VENAGVETARWFARWEMGNAGRDKLGHCSVGMQRSGCDGECRFRGMLWVVCCFFLDVSFIVFVFERSSFTLPTDSMWMYNPNWCLFLLAGFREERIVCEDGRYHVCRTESIVNPPCIPPKHAYAVLCSCHALHL